MQKIIIDGKEFVLVPSEQLKEVTPEPLKNTAPDPTQSVLEDFLAPDAPMHPDDGLATEEEKQEAIKVTVQSDNPQDIVTGGITAVPKATPRPYSYRERFLKKQILPSDVMTFSRVDQDFLDSNPEDPWIKADAKLPKHKRLFYGPSTEQE